MFDLVGYLINCSCWFMMCSWLYCLSRFVVCVRDLDLVLMMIVIEVNALCGLVCFLFMIVVSPLFMLFSL